MAFWGKKEAPFGASVRTGTLGSDQPVQKSWVRMVLRPLAFARFTACSTYHITTPLRPSRASPAVLQPPFLIAAFTLLATRTISIPFLAISLSWVEIRRRGIISLL